MQLVIYVNVVPHWGFYGFLLATMMSLGIGHICLGCHRLIVERKVPPVASGSATTAESISSHVFAVDSRLVSVTDADASAYGINNRVSVDSTRPASSPTAGSNTVYLKASRAGQVTMFLAISLSIVMLFFGVIYKTFTFSFKGLTGLLLKSAGGLE